VVAVRPWWPGGGLLAFISSPFSLFDFVVIIIALTSFSIFFVTAKQTNKSSP
jgi:hypothetical protein